MLSGTLQLNNGEKVTQTNGGEIPIHVFEPAANAMRGGLSGRSAAKQFGIDQTAFRRYLKKASKESSEQVKMGYTKHRKIFTDEMEKDLAEHCINLVKQHHGLFMDKVKMLAYKFAEKKQVAIPNDNRKAGRDWMCSFMKRHNLSLKAVNHPANSSGLQ